jgi:TonB family protein
VNGRLLYPQDAGAKKKTDSYAVMKTCIVLLWICTFSIGAFAQATKKITAKNDFPPFTESYNVLKANAEIKHGAYQKQLRGKILVKGQYDNNNKSGVWEFYNLEGQISQKYNFSTDELIYDRQLEGQKFDTTNYSRPALFIGGFHAMYLDMMYHLRYPAEAVRMNVQGEVRIKAEVTADGNATNEEVIQGIGFGCDEEVLRVFRLVSNQWIHALDKNGNPVASEVIFPLRLRLQ